VALSQATSQTPASAPIEAFAGYIKDRVSIHERPKNAAHLALFGGALPLSELLLLNRKLGVFKHQLELRIRLKLVSGLKGERLRLVILLQELVQSILRRNRLLGCESLLPGDRCRARIGVNSFSPQLAIKSRASEAWA
jgi:hypothetical protein